MSQFPIIVEKFDAVTSLMLGCNGCGTKHLCEDPEMFMEASEAMPCPRCGSRDFGPAYDLGQRCGSCGRMSPGHPLVTGADSNVPACSRVCKLQIEYAEALRKGRNEGARPPAAA